MFIGHLCGAIVCMSLHVTADSINKHLIPTRDHVCGRSFYHVIGEVNVTWSEAWELCRLAIITDETEKACIDQSVYGYDVQLWTAGVQLDSNWTWITGTRYRGFNLASQPDEQCASISVTGVYDTWPCMRALKSYICHLPSAGCRDKTIFTECHIVYHNANICVLMCHSQNGYTWFSARNKCLQGNGDLISFDDVEVANGVISRIEHEMGSTQEVMWIGLTRELWAWTLRNGTRTITYSYWDQGEPYKPERRANCLALESGNGPTTWRSLDCNTALGAVLCQATNNRSSTTRRTLNDTSDDTNQTENSKTNVKSTWLKDDMTILMLSIASAIIFILLLVIVSLIICLRNARRINVLLGSKPKTYFDYFDLGFRRKLPTMAPSSEHNRTVVLTNDMLTSSNRDGNQVGNDDHS